MKRAVRDYRFLKQNYRNFCTTNNCAISKSLVLLIIFLVYWASGRQYIGPAYLSDEIGYVTKAAALAGFSIDFSSSWRAGYSILLAPLFRLLSDPFSVWQGIVIANAVFWVVSFGLLIGILKYLFPLKSQRVILFVVAVCSLYPAWITMSGYAFSTPGFVMIFMLSLYLLLTRPCKQLNLFIYSVLIGCLYWIHPVGTAVAIASFLSIVYLSLETRNYKTIFYHLIVTLLIIFGYKYGLHPWLSNEMTPAGYTPTEHYRSVGGVINNVFTTSFWSKWPIAIMGHFAYIIISTFGVAGYAIHFAIRSVLEKNSTYQESEEKLREKVFFLFITLSVIGTILIGALSFSLNSSLRFDQWIYGRYTEMVTLPLIGIGLVCGWRDRIVLFMCLCALAVAITFFLFVDAANSSKVNNLVNMPSFWPYYLSKSSEYIFLISIGIAGIILFRILGRKYYFVMMIPLYLFSISAQSTWHRNILDRYSNPTSLVGFIRSNYPTGHCIGFGGNEPGALPERRSLYSFYFYDYGFRRTSFDEWYTTCEGPFITQSDAEIANYPKDVSIIARGNFNRLFVIVKNNDLNKLDFGLLDEKEYLIDRVGNNQDCFLVGCFSMSANDLIRHSQVGKSKDGGIVTTGKSGHLFFGPYVPIHAGTYNLSITGVLGELTGAKVDIAANRGKTVFARFDNLTDFKKDGTLFLGNIFIDKDVDDLEVRLTVTSDTKLKVTSYKLTSKSVL